MKAYADYEYYSEPYLLGREPKIPEGEFGFFAMQASSRIRTRTFERLDGLEEIPEEARMCCCEAAERLYAAERAKGENGLILQSYSNDGDSGTYRADEATAAVTETGIDEIIRRWLGHTGLLYCGVAG